MTKAEADAREATRVGNKKPVPPCVSGCTSLAPLKLAAEAATVNEMLTKLRTVLRRFGRGLPWGICYLGDSRFILPRRLLWRGRWATLNVQTDWGQQISFRSILLDDEYYLNRLPRNLATVADVGANVGVFLLAARRRFPAARLQAFEPNAHVGPSLAHQAGLAQAAVFMVAVGAEHGTIRVTWEGPSTYCRAVPDRDGAVEQFSLQEVVDGFGGSIDLLKLDCEGAEWDILQNAQDALRAVRYIAMEYHCFGEAQTVARLLELVARNGFRLMAHHVDANDPRLGVVLAVRDTANALT